MKLFRQHFDYEQLQNTFQKYENTSNAGHLSTKQPFQINKKYLSTCISFLKTKSTFSPIFHILLKKQMTIKRTHIYGQPKDLDYHLPWQWRSPSKLTRILSTKPFLYSYTLYVCRWRLLLRPQLESGRAKGFNPLQIRKYFNFK